MFRLLHRLAEPFLLLRGLLCAALFLPGGEGKEKTRQNARKRAFAPSGQSGPQTPCKGSANPLPNPAKAHSEK